MKTRIEFPKAVLFDFDGVLVNSFQCHYNAWKSAYLELFNEENLYFPHKELAGKSPILIAEHLCNSIGQPHKSDEYFKLKAAHLHASKHPPELLPGGKEIHKFLSSNLIPQGIASNATQQFIKNSIEQLGLGFTTFFGIENYKFPKPHPEPYITLAKSLGIKDHFYKNTWVFEDSITGIQAVKAANMIPIGISTLNSEEILLNAGSMIVFKDLYEAYEYLKKLKET